MLTAPSVPPQATTPEELAESFRFMIRNGSLRPAQVLVQDALAKQFGVSRSPVREALRILEGEGLVAFGSRGTFVVPLDPRTVEEIYSLRLLIEPTMAGDIIANASPVSIARLQKLADEMAAAAETAPLRWSEDNYEFHHAMYGLSPRSLTSRIIKQLLDKAEPYSRIYIATLGGRGVASHQHGEMMVAIKAGDAGALASEITSHLTDARDRLTAWMRMSGPVAVDPAVAERPKTP